MKVNEAIELLKSLDNNDVTINVELVVEEKKVRELQFLEEIEHKDGNKYIFINYADDDRTRINVIGLKTKIYFKYSLIKDFKL